MRPFSFCPAEGGPKTGNTLVAPSNWLTILLIALLFLGLAEMPSGFGLLMRIAVTGYALYTALRVFIASYTAYKGT